MNLVSFRFPEALLLAGLSSVLAASVARASQCEWITMPDGRLLCQLPEVGVYPDPGFGGGGGGWSPGQPLPGSPGHAIYCTQLRHAWNTNSCQSGDFPTGPWFPGEHTFSYASGLGRLNSYRGEAGAYNAFRVLEALDIHTENLRIGMPPPQAHAMLVNVLADVCIDEIGTGLSVSMTLTPLEQSCLAAFDRIYFEATGDGGWPSWLTSFIQVMLPDMIAIPVTSRLPAAEPVVRALIAALLSPFGSVPNSLDAKAGAIVAQHQCAAIAFQRQAAGCP